MSYRQNNAERLLDNFGWEYYGYKNDKLRVQGDTILDTHTPIGKIVGRFNDEKDEYEQYLLLTMQDFKSQPSWRNHKLQLAKAASTRYTSVIFVPEIDIGFGDESTDMSVDIDLDKIYKDLLKVVKYSQDIEFKNACCAIILGYGEAPNKIVAYTYSQDFGGDSITSAQRILCDYINFIDPLLQNEYIFVSLREPDSKGLSAMIQTGAIKIYYSQKQNSNWVISDYVQLVNDIFTREIRGKNNRPIIYKRKPNDKVEKYYSKEVK